MVLGPADIERVQFKVTRVKEGYDQDEVDNFLDRVSETLRQALSSNGNMEAENVRLRSENATLKRQLTAASEAPTQALPPVPAEAPKVEPTVAASRLLELAQKTADEVVAQAQKNAADIQARADENARDTLNKATNDADARRRKAEAEAYGAEQELAKIKETRDATRSHLVAQLDNLKNLLGDQ